MSIKNSKLSHELVYLQQDLYYLSQELIKQSNQNLDKTNTLIILQKNYFFYFNCLKTIPDNTFNSNNSLISYKPHLNDKIDEKIFEFLKNNEKRINIKKFKRIKEGLYSYRNIKLKILIIKGEKLMVKTDAGYVEISQYFNVNFLD